MRSTITADIDVDVPLDVAYNQWTQFETFADFMEAVDDVEQLDSTHTHWRVHVGGVEREFDAVITEQLPDDHIAWQSVDGTMHMGRVDFERIDDGRTHVTATIEWEPESFLEHAGAVLNLDDMQVSRDLRRFKELIEQRGHETGSWRGTVIDGAVAPVTENQAHIDMHRGHGHETPRDQDMLADADSMEEVTDMDAEINNELNRDDVNTARLHHDHTHREARENDTTVDDTGLNPDTDLFHHPKPDEFRQA